MMMMMVMMERKEGGGMKGGGAKQAPTRERRAGRARTQFVFAPTVSPIREERTSSASRGTEEDALALALAAAAAAAIAQVPSPRVGDARSTLRRVAPLPLNDDRVLTEVGHSE